MITDSSVQKALKDAPNSGNSVIEIKEDGPRGEGRLALIIRIKRTEPVRITSDWYAVWYTGGRRVMSKIGAYPTVTVADARRQFTTDFAPVIARGEKPIGPRARRQRAGVTVKDLFQAYIDYLKAREAPSVKGVEYALLTGSNAASKSIGETKRAADVTPADIIPHLSEIHGRGAVCMASAVRSYIGSAFAYAMASENSYTRQGGVAWGVRINPVLAIPADTEANRVGERHLTPSEFRALWRWLEAQDERSGVAPALRLIMATGQRVTEILRLTKTMYDKPAKMLDWGKTKNGQPHNIPLSPQAVELMGKVAASGAGLYFPGRGDGDVRVTVQSVEALVYRYLKEHPGVEHFTPRDLRRTWKTLAGAAGLSKDIRDRLQNHARSDVSSRHYDRYEMLPERRAAVAVWSKYLGRILDGSLDTEVAQLAAAE